MKNKIKIGGLIERKKMCLIVVLGINNKPGSVGEVFEIFGDEKIPLEFISENESYDGFSNVAMCISDKYHNKIDSLLNKMEQQLSPKKILNNCEVHILTIYGPHFAHKPSIAAHLCSALRDENINILGITTSINSVTCIIDSKDGKKARKAIKGKFKFPDY